jgi:hypothetical protein
VISSNATSANVPQFGVSSGQRLSARPLSRLALEIREQHPGEYRQVSADALRPGASELATLGVKGADASHIADAVALGCDYFLTNDRRLRKKSDVLEDRWSLRCRRPSEFVVEAVRSGAPWPSAVPWPWENMKLRWLRRSVEA